MPDKNTNPNHTNKPSNIQSLMYVIRFIAQPLMFLVAGLLLLGVLGLAQRMGWISARGAEDGGANVASSAADVDYICPMMCTPPQKEPGRCPVCAMELVPASGGGDGGDERSVVVDPATRRVINIQTVSVERRPLCRTILAVGEIGYDEGKMKTISAYVTGRFDAMYVDYVGAVVSKGDRLAEFYSPDLYSAQVEYLQAEQAATNRGAVTAVNQANQRLRNSARQRLVELGMSDEQLTRLSRSRSALSRLDILAPMHGTVVERLAVEGEYVKEGQPVFRLADLSTVWLLLKLFPDDAAEIRYGQAVEARLKSMPNRSFSGRIAFIDPKVNKDSRTVSVRVVLNNADGMLRIGDYAKATIDVPTGASSSPQIYDPELASKWISPRHPHVISDSPGLCKLCGIQLVPASDLGFTSEKQVEEMALVVPRSAVLSAANESVVYVETETGRFEIRRVITGPTADGLIVIVKGLAEGEKVATSGSFLLDSQMQLAGNASIIDPSRAAPPMEMIAGFSAKELAEIQQLPDSEQAMAIEQVICPVTEYNLGSMGVPPKVEVNGETVFICCEGCREALLEEPALHLAKLESYKTNGLPASNDDGTFEVPEIGEITIVEEGDVIEPLPIESIESGDSFEIEVPSLSPSLDGSGGIE